MIVVDVNVVAYLLIDGPFTSLARQVLQKDPVWVAPPLWRYEFLNILATTVRENRLGKEDATRILASASQFVDDSRPEADRLEVFRLSVLSRVATYDCEYVQLARGFGTKLVTNDRPMLTKFPDVAIGLEAFLA